MDYKDINQEAFFSKVNKTNACWLWTGAIFKGCGYGQFAVKRHPQKAHRVSWVIHNGKIPTDRYICHTCDNPLCVNPEHLWLGSHKDNMHDRDTKGRQRSNPTPYKGEEHPQSILTEEQVRFIRENKGKISQRKLAALFNVGQTTVGHAQRKETWEYLDKR